MKYWSGMNFGYCWLEVDSNDFGFKDVVEQFADIIVDNYLIIRTFDGGLIEWTKDEENLGFSYLNGLPITSRIKNPDILPFDQYDEWYVFNQVKAVSLDDNFVNNETFSLRKRNFNEEKSMIDKSLDQRALENDIDKLSRLQNSFWKQLMQSEADKFLSQNGKFILVSKEKNEIERIERFCSFTH